MAEARSSVPSVINGWKLSGHARHTIAARAFDVRDVLQACENPEQSYTAYNYGPDRWVYQRAHVAVVLSPVTRTVITVLLRRREQWDDNDARAVNGAGNGRDAA